MKIRSRVYALGMIAVLGFTVYCTQKILTEKKSPLWLKESMSYLPQSEKIKPYLLGFSSTFANYLWIKTILYFGGHYMSDKDYVWLVSMVDMVTKLNPYFYPAYEFAGVMLPSYTGDLCAARIILNRGISYLGNSKYTIPFYLGWIYFDRYKDYAQAGLYLSLASRNKNVPPYIPALAATLYANAGQKDIALGFLYSAYLTSENPAVKRTVRDKIQQLGGSLE